MISDNSQFISRKAMAQMQKSFFEELEELAADLDFVEQYGFPTSPDDPKWIAHCAAQRRSIDFSTEGEERMRITNEGDWQIGPAFREELDPYFQYQQAMQEREEPLERKRVLSSRG